MVLRSTAHAGRSGSGLRVAEAVGLGLVLSLLVLASLPPAAAAQTVISITIANGATACSGAGSLAPLVTGSLFWSSPACYVSGTLTIPSGTVLDVGPGVTVSSNAASGANGATGISGTDGTRGGNGSAGSPAIDNSGTINNNGTIFATGGAGGNGGDGGTATTGTAGNGGTGGTGGVGVSNTGTINNNGTFDVYGGSGGAGGNGGSATGGTAGNGGTGGVGGIGINNSGTIDNVGKLIVANNVGGGGGGSVGGTGGDGGNGGIGTSNFGTFTNSGTVYTRGGDGGALGTGNAGNGIQGAGGNGTANRVTGVMNNAGDFNGQISAGGSGQPTVYGISNYGTIDDYCGAPLNGQYAGTLAVAVSCVTVTFDQSGIPTTGVTWGLSASWGPFTLPQNHSGTGGSIAVPVAPGNTVTYSYESPVPGSGATYVCQSGCSGSIAVSSATNTSASYSGGAPVPDLPYGVIPLLLAVPVLYYLISRRNAGQGQGVPPQAQTDAV